MESCVTARHHAIRLARHNLPLMNYDNARRWRVMNEMNLMNNLAGDLERALVTLIESLPPDICIPATVSSMLIKWSIPINKEYHGTGHHRNTDPLRSRSAVNVTGSGALVAEQGL